MSRLRRFWRRLLSREDSAAEADDDLEQDLDAPPAADEPPPPDQLQLCLSTPGSPAQPTSRAERELLAVAERLQSDRREGQPPSDERLLSSIEELLADGALRRTNELLELLVKELPDRPALRLRLAELHYDQRRLPEALPLLRELAVDHDDARALRANFMLGDHHRQEAEYQRALQHFEAILARDFGYQRARSRAEDIRAKLDRPVAAAAPTILGAGDIGSGGRFLLQRELGRGGGGTVYLALERLLERPLAVKVLHPRVARQADARTHLFCEARIAASLQHPQIICIYDLDESLNLVAMEYCRGGTLADRISTAPLPPARALRRLEEMSQVLDIVHRAGVVHRDIKPANWLIREAGSSLLVLSDFGIAHAVVEDARDGDVAGSRTFMAPEQRAGAASDPRVDLYACGAILLAMLLGRPPLSPQQALQGALPLEIDELWRELEAVATAALRGPLLALCRDLVQPDPAKRAAEAGDVTRRASDLRRRFETAEERNSVAADLERRAGPEPRSPEVERWLEGFAGAR